MPVRVSMLRPPYFPECLSPISPTVAKVKAVPSPGVLAVWKDNGFVVSPHIMV